MRKGVNRNPRTDLAVVWLVFVFLFSASTLLTINSFLAPKTSFELRSILAFLAQLAIFLNSFWIIRDKLLRVALILWFAGIVIWRTFNFFGTIERPIFAEPFFIAFLGLILYSQFREVLKEKINGFLIASLVVLVSILAYFDFLFGKEIKITVLYTFIDSLIIALSLALLTKISEVRHIGYFLLGVADFTLLWQLRGGGYYIGSWVEIIFVMALFIFTLGFRKIDNGKLA